MRPSTSQNVHQGVISFLTFIVENSFIGSHERNLGAPRPGIRSGVVHSELVEDGIGVDKLKALENVLVPLCARYLVSEKRDGMPIDPVARFHFGNGARLDRINWLANPSARGLAESLGIMVNYVYEPSEIEDNHEAYYREGRLAVSGAVRKLLRKGGNDAASEESRTPAP